MYSRKTLALAVAPLLLAVHASVDLDMDDVPVSCKTICGPVGQLSDKCDTDLPSDVDRDEKLLEAQCVCTNKSFAVAKIAALCADCMHQSARQGRRDDDKHADQGDLRGQSAFIHPPRVGTNADHGGVDIDNLLATCGFPSTTYSTAATSEVQNINVVATAPTDIKQLTTTLTGGPPPPARTSGSASGSGSTTGGIGSSGGPSGATTAVGSRSSAVSGSQTSTTTRPTANAAPGVQPLGGVSVARVLCVAGAFVAGGWMMLQ